MENKKVLTKKNIGGILLDIFTIGMLFASFAALFYSGFILKTETFPLIALCAITAVGLLLLFFIGAVSCLASKSKNNTLTPGFLVFSAVQLVALIVNIALLICVLIKLFSVDGLFARLTYVISVSVVLIGYVVSISYFSDGSVGDASDLETTDEEEYETDEENESEEEDEIAEIEESVEVEEETGETEELTEKDGFDEDEADEDDEASDEETKLS